MNNPYAKENYISTKIGLGFVCITVGEYNGISEDYYFDAMPDPDSDPEDNVTRYICDKTGKEFYDIEDCKAHVKSVFYNE